MLWSFIFELGLGHHQELLEEATAIFNDELTVPSARTQMCLSVNMQHAVENINFQAKPRFFIPVEMAERDG